MAVEKTLNANAQPFDAFEGAEKIWTFKRMIYWQNEAGEHYLKAAKPLSEETLSHAKIRSASFSKKHIFAHQIIRCMIIANKQLLADFVQSRSNAAKPLNKWVEVI